MTEFPRGLVVLACVVVAIGAALFGLLRTGIPRLLGLGVALLALIAQGVLLISDGGHLVEAIVIVAGLGAATYAARAAFRVRVELLPARPPAHPVLLYNPKSGGGKAERFSLADEAAKRGIESIELTRGADLEQLVRDAVAGGADALAMAGGDGSQAVVASVASELDLPYACIPAGTRNHFALDLGVDRDDVVGALDAFVEGGERRVDLAEVNGRVFVNNVSLGLYAEAVQRDEYRDAKIRTILNTVPESLGPDSEGLDLAWTGPDGERERSGAALLVSNNRYRLGRAVGSGTRPRIDAGVLGRRRGQRTTGCRLRAASEALARVDRHRIRRRFEPAGPRWSRRRGDDPRAAPAIQDPPGGPAGAYRPGSSRSVALGRHPGEILGRREDTRRGRGGPGTGRGLTDNGRRT